MSDPAPKGYRTVSPYLVTPEVEAVVAFAETVFDATIADGPVMRPDGRIMHVALEIGDSVVLLGTPPDGVSVKSAFLHVYTKDCDAAHATAVAAGAESEMPPADQPHGDRAAMVRDTAGNRWWIATRIVPAGAEDRARRRDQKA